VITVPAYFGIAERDATRKAGQIAGLEVLDIVSEPIAAAIDYGVLDIGEDKTVLVYDLGGGTFDTTVIRLEGGNIEVVCTGGDHRLGGADWDERLLAYLIEEFQSRHPDAGDPRDDVNLYQELNTASEDIKRALSTAQKRPQRVAYGGATAVIEVTRESFEDRTRDLLDRTIMLTSNTLETARARGVSVFDEVILVGGATRMPAVARALGELVGREPRMHDPDLAVAKGAARYGMEEQYRRLVQEGETVKAAALARSFTPEERAHIQARSIVTVAPRGFGVRIVENARVSLDRKVIDHLIHANDQLPATRQQTYYTIWENQESVVVELFEQKGSIESREVDDNDLVIGGEVTQI
ncbi:MAG: Hsp70 family protein, partial [Actinomycetota bacterium]